MNKDWELLSRMGVEVPSGDLARDLNNGKRVLLRRGQPCVRVSRAPDLGDRVLQFVASTDGIKRDGNRVRNDAASWDFGNFAKNPVMLWTHDYGSSERPPMPPIGSWVDWRIEPDGNGANALVMSGRFATHEFADLVYNLYAEGHMRAVSIGWTPIEYHEILDNGKFVGWDFVRNELLECSAVPIPADPDAIMVAAQRGLIPERSLEHFGNWMAPSRGIAYVLDSRDRPVADATRNDSASVPPTVETTDTDERGDDARAEGVASVTCPACGAACPENANYCPTCGAALTVEDAAPAAEGTTDTPAVDDAEAREQAEPEAAEPAEPTMLDAVHRARECSDQMSDSVARMCDAAERCWGQTRAAEDAPADDAADGAEDPMVVATTAAEAVMAMATEIVTATQAIYEALVGDAAEDATEPAEGTSMAEQAASIAAAAKRVGKKISAERMSALEDAHERIRSGVQHLREILDHAKQDLTASAPDEAAELRARVHDLIERKEAMILRRRVESLVERKASLSRYAATLLPGRAS